MARFFGAQNLLPGTLQADGRTVVTDLGQLHLAHTDAAPGPVMVMIRPEHIRLHTQDVPGIPGQVSACQFLGTVYRYTVAVRSVLLTAIRLDAAFQLGDTVSVSLPPEHLWVMPA